MTEPLTVLIQNNTNDVQLVELFNSDYNVPGVEIKMKIGEKDFKEGNSGIRARRYTGFIYATVLPVKGKYAHEPGFQVEKDMMHTMGAEFVSKDEDSSVIIPLPFKIEDNQNQSNVAALEIEFPLNAGDIIRFRAQPHAHYQFVFYAPKD